MQKPMEILSQMIKRTDSGTGIRKRAGVNAKDGSSFDRTLEEALMNAEPLPLMKERKPDAVIARKAPSTEKVQKPQEDEGGELAAGAIEIQNAVVFILEGEKESATTPEASADAVMFALPGDTADRTGTIAPPDPVAETEGIPSAAEERIAEDAAPISAASAGNTPIAAPREEDAGTAKTEKASDSGAPIEGSGEVTARMPVMRMSERKENADANSGFSEQGNRGPLENENDRAPVKGQKVKTYSETVKTVRNAAASAPETANNTPPLAEGIKPEQYRAIQQMRQATPGAPVRAENLFNEMVSRVETMISDSKSAMSIQLKPEYLGKAALEIAMDASGLHVKISVTDSGIRTMINGQINSLIESLGTKGIEVVEVEVAYTGVDNNAFKESREGRPQPERPRRPYRGAETIDGAAYYSVLPFEMLDYYLDAGVSSVEYRA